MTEPEWTDNIVKAGAEQLGSVMMLTYGVGTECAHIYMCQPFAGIYLWANDVQMSRIPAEEAQEVSFVKLNICLEGHCEVLLADGKYVYLEPGILSLDSNRAYGFYQYQTRHYCGIEIAVDLSQVETGTEQLFAAFGLSRERQEETLKGRDGSYLGRVDGECLERATELYKNLTEARLESCDHRFALLQLLYALNKHGTTTVEKDIYLTKGQREIAQQAEHILSEDFSTRYTVEELAAEFAVSPSSLKKYFALRYGEPVSVHMRKKRLAYAARLLAEKEESIGEIAEKAGYASQSKFCGVFKKHMGMTPLEYRRLHVITKEERE